MAFLVQATLAEVENRQLFSATRWSTDNQSKGKLRQILVAKWGELF